MVENTEGIRDSPPTTRDSGASLAAGPWGSPDGLSDCHSPPPATPSPTVHDRGAVKRGVEWRAGSTRLRFEPCQLCWALMNTHAWLVPQRRPRRHSLLRWHGSPRSAVPTTSAGGPASRARVPPPPPLVVVLVPPPATVVASVPHERGCPCPGS